MLGFTNIVKIMDKVELFMFLKIIGLLALLLLSFYGLGVTIEGCMTDNLNKVIGGILICGGCYGIVSLGK